MQTTHISSRSYSAMRGSAKPPNPPRRRASGRPAHQTRPAPAARTQVRFPISRPPSPGRLMGRTTSAAARHTAAAQLTAGAPHTAAAQLTAGAPHTAVAQPTQWGAASHTVNSSTRFSDPATPTNLIRTTATRISSGSSGWKFHIWII